MDGSLEVGSEMELMQNIKKTKNKNLIHYWFIKLSEALTFGLKDTSVCCCLSFRGSVSSLFPCLGLTSRVTSMRETQWWVSSESFKTMLNQCVYMHHCRMWLIIDSFLAYYCLCFVFPFYWILGCSFNEFLCSRMMGVKDGPTKLKK